MGKRGQPSSSGADQKAVPESGSESAASDDTLLSDPSQKSEPEGDVESEDALAQVKQGIGVGDGSCMEEKHAMTMTATTMQQTDTDQAAQEGSADADSKDDEVSRELHIKIRQLAETESWPNGPDSLQGLFSWPQWNAARLLDVPSMNLMKERIERLLYVLSLDIEIHESYAGTGNGSVCLHRQLHALRMECQKLAVTCVLFQNQDAIQSF